MRATQIDLKSSLPHVIQAYTEIFGEEYHSIISDKINSAIIIPYDDINELEHYNKTRKDCKKEELIIEFLQIMGMNIPKQDSYFNGLDWDTYEIIYSIFDSVVICFEIEHDAKLPIRAFKYNDKIDNRVKLINYLRGNKKPRITEKNLEEFSKTPEFNELLIIINKMNKVYDDLAKKYNEWEKRFESDMSFIQNEKKRKQEILKKKRDEVWLLTFQILPSPIKKSLKDKSMEEQIDAVLSHYKLDEEFLIEYFSQENINKLLSPNTPKSKKCFIIEQQIKFLENMGYERTINPRNFVANIEDYLQFLSQDNIKQFIPSDEVISYIKLLRKRKNKEANKDFTIGREDFQDALSIFGNKHEFMDTLTRYILEREVCITGAGAKTSEGKFISVMFFTIRAADFGILAFILLHELGHIIDHSKHGIGFEPISDYYPNGNRNPYDNAYRKYEKFNEAITDIFTIEAIKILHKKNIFLIEPKEITDLNCTCLNTSTIVHNLLNPLIDKFRKQVIKTKIFSQPQILTECIGEDNFEDLVDVVNKVDYLVRNGLTKEKIEKEPQDSMVIEYDEQLERIIKIYQNIDEYYTNYCASLEEKEQKQNT